MEKTNKLIDYIKKFDKVGIAFSGGTDSAFLLATAVKAVGAARVFAITVDSVLVPRKEISDAAAFAEELGVKAHIIKADALNVEQVRQNDKTRCYHCKKNIYSSIKNKAIELGASVIMDGKNADDEKEYRPGACAAEELSVISPLAMFAFTKEEIRSESKRLGSATWSKPANACLATRLPYNTEVNTDILKKIEETEILLNDVGINPVRARVHGEILRIEAKPDDFHVIINNKNIKEELHGLGFRYITLDLDGIRSGSMD